MLIFAGLGFSFSHLMRFAIIRGNLFNKPLSQQVIAFMVITIVFAFAVGSLESILTRVMDVRTSQQKAYGEWTHIISNTFASFVYFFLRNCIYFSYHYVQRRREQQLETLRLEALLKEYQQNAIRG